MTMETDPDAINDNVRATLLKRGKAYADDNAESKERNKSRAEGREAIKAIGMNPNAFATAMKHIKDMSPREQKQWLDDYRVVLKVHGPAQKELFPEEAMKHEKREADRKAREAEEKAEAKRQAEADKPGSRSDPKSGGAGKAEAKPKAGKGKAAAAVKAQAAGLGEQKPAHGDGSEVKMKSPAETMAEGAAASDASLSAAIEKMQANEQAEGEAALSAMSPQSQSAQAAAVREKLGL